MGPSWNTVLGRDGLSRDLVDEQKLVCCAQTGLERITREFQAREEAGNGRKFSLTLTGRKRQEKHFEVNNVKGKNFIPQKWHGGTPATSSSRE